MSHELSRVVTSTLACAVFSGVLFAILYYGCTEREWSLKRGFGTFCAMLATWLFVVPATHPGYIGRHRYVGK